MIELLEFLNEVKNFLLDHFLMVLIVDIINSSVDGQNFHPFVSVNPILVPFMDSLKIINTDIFLSLSVSDLDSRVTNFRGTLQVDDSLDGTILDECMTN